MIKHYEQNMNRYIIYSTSLIYIVLILVMDMVIPLGVAVGVLYVVAVLISLWAPDKRFTVFIALLSSIFTIYAFYFKPPIFDMWKVTFNRGISLFAIWTTAFMGLQRKLIEQSREKAVFEREKALAELKILKGILSICSSCKRIRDENGYWKTIEGYIREHSEADFSHGLCEECALKLYPDLFKFKKKGSFCGDSCTSEPRTLTRRG